MTPWILMKSDITDGAYCPVYFGNVYVLEKRKIGKVWFIGFFGKRI